MPVIPLPPVAFASLPPKAAPPLERPDVIVSFKNQTADVEKQIVTYSDGVVVTFLPTMISADRVELHKAPGEEFGVATGHVKLTDPAGIVTADKLIFRWKAKTGEADNAFVESGGFKVWTAHIDIQAERTVKVVGKDGKPKDEVFPARWTLTDVSATGCSRPLPSYMFKTSSVVIEPGHGGTAYHPDFYVLGHKIIRLPTQHFSLDRRSPGIGLPTLSLNRDNLIGATWKGGLLVDSKTAFTFNASAFPGRLASGRATIARSFVPAAENSSPLVPQSEFSERFGGGYFDNIRVSSFESEELATRRPQNLIGASTFLHVTAGARNQIERFDVPLQLTAQRSFQFGGWGLLAVARADSLQPLGSSMQYRVAGQFALSPPRLRIGSNLYGVSRMDASSFVGKTGYGWVRGQAGLVFEPAKWLSMGAIYFGSSDFGVSQFEMDPLASKGGMSGRIDLKLGSTRIGYLLKYDARRRSLYDREYTFTQVVGCLEVFVDYRKFPNNYAVGVIFRTDGLFDKLRKRSIEAARQVKPLSGPDR